MTSKGPKAERIPKRKCGGICRDCPLQRDLRLKDAQVFCGAEHATIGMNRWKLIPNGPCKDRPGSDTASALPSPWVTSLAQAG